MIREMALALTGWIVFSLLLAGTWVVTGFLYRWRYRRDLRRRFKRAATSSSAGVTNREGRGRGDSATGISTAALDRPPAESPSAFTQGARSSRDSGREGFPRRTA